MRRNYLEETEIWDLILMFSSILIRLETVRGTLEICADMHIITRWKRRGVRDTTRRAYTAEE